MPTMWKRWNTVRQSRKSRKRSHAVRGRFENLEERRVLAVVWVNQGSPGNDTDKFDQYYTSNAQYARQIVSHAIADWNASLSSATQLSLTFIAGPIANAGETTIMSANANGLPTAATIRMDDNANVSLGWYMDTSIASDAEFGQLDTMFSGTTTDSFVQARADFYTAVAHEIGHALGYSNSSLVAIKNYLTTNPTTGQTFLTAPATPYSLGTIEVSRSGGLHSLDQYDLMYGNGVLGNRKLINDTTVKILANVYGYTVPVNNGMPMLPSYRDTLHVNVDPATQTVSVFGLKTAANEFSTIQVSTPNMAPNIPNTYSISLGGSLEHIPNSYTTFNFNMGDGNDTVYVSLDNSPNLIGYINLNMGPGNDTIFYQSWHASLADYEVKLVGNVIDRPYRYVGPSQPRQVSYLATETLNIFTGTGSDLVTLSPTFAGNPNLTTVTVTTYDGADNINASGSALGVEIYAGAGADTITGSSFADILLGEAGNDIIIGNAGRDLLFGGLGIDSLLAQSDADEDLIVSGTTSFDANRAVLRTIRAEWTSSRTRAQRISNISGSTSGGLNGANYLNGSTVFDDAAADNVFLQANDWWIS